MHTTKQLANGCVPDLGGEIDTKKHIKVEGNLTYYVKESRVVDQSLHMHTKEIRHYHSLAMMVDMSRMEKYPRNVEGGHLPTVKNNAK